MRGCGARGFGLSVELTSFLGSQWVNCREYPWMLPEVHHCYLESNSPNLPTSIFQLVASLLSPKSEGFVIGDR